MIVPESKDELLKELTVGVVAAYVEPITLTKHGRASVVVVSAETFERLISNDDPRRVYGTGETPPDLAEMLVNELDRQSAEYQAGKDE